MLIKVVRSTIVSSILLLTTWIFLISLSTNAAAVIGSDHDKTGHRWKGHTTGGGGVNFLNIRVLHDGERELRLHYGHVSVIETAAVSIRNISNNNNGGLPDHKGLRLVRITDGRHFLQSIYDKEGSLMDCEYVRDENSVNKFLEEMKPDLKLARNLQRIYSDRVDSFPTIDIDDGLNKTILLRERDVTEELRKLSNYDAQRKECKTLHQKMKRMAKHKTSR